MDYTTNNLKETKAVAAEFAKTLEGGELVALHGDLGAGKTTFVQGLAEALGVEEPVRSPTFSLVKIYPTQHASIRHLVHADLYRLEGTIDLEEIGLEEWLNRKDAVVVVEWAEKMGDNPGSFSVIFDIKDVQKRMISVVKN